MTRHLHLRCHPLPRQAHRHLYPRQAHHGLMGPHHHSHCCLYTLRATNCKGTIFDFANAVLGQAYLAAGDALGDPRLECTIGSVSRLICTISPNWIEDLRFELELEEDGDITFTINGPRGVHLAMTVGMAGVVMRLARVGVAMCLAGVDSLGHLPRHKHLASQRRVSPTTQTHQTSSATPLSTHYLPSRATQTPKLLPPCISGDPNMTHAITMFTGLAMKDLERGREIDRS
ncbi:hypothetical protein L6452_20054 [Arctium lappa]|uniref:Uncharacterized protein n=1 Tax=Arctium lappa TaxID=4217 RepID=A0ACB9BB26_ARCLA|nr:hypothetical protein L6452_20054 [Arctium lappa]